MFFDLLDTLPVSALIGTIATAALAGLIRGFTGFGSALIFIPLASVVLGPKTAVATLFLVEAVFTLPLMLGASRQANWFEVLPLATAAVAAGPIGVMLLATLDPITLRWSIAAIVVAFLALLVSGWRYRGSPAIGVTMAVGGIAGVFGGAAQISGPPVVAYWLGGLLPAHRIRANLIIFFSLAMFGSGAAYLANGLLSPAVLGLSMAVGPAYGLAALVGEILFRIAGRRSYRPVAYVVIGLSALASLPALDGVIR